MTAAQPAHLLQRFLAEEVTPDVRSLLLGSIAEASRDGEIERRSFEFNIFDVTLDFKAGVVTVADVLSASNEERLGLLAFQAALTEGDEPRS